MPRVDHCTLQVRAPQSLVRMLGGNEPEKLNLR
jgi:hypothetical protein